LTVLSIYDFHHWLFAVCHSDQASPIVDCFQIQVPCAHFFLILNARAIPIDEFRDNFICLPNTVCSTKFLSFWATRFAIFSNYTICGRIKNFTNSLVAYCSRYWSYHCSRYDFSILFYFLWYGRTTVVSYRDGIFPSKFSMKDPTWIRRVIFDIDAGFIFWVFIIVILLK
jgi:hypothetical protein